MQINFIQQKYNVMNQKCINLFSKSEFFFCEMRDGHDFGEIGPHTNSQRVKHRSSVLDRQKLVRTDRLSLYVYAKL